jgi:tetratricopeptide (TPR) repeat protein
MERNRLLIISVVVILVALLGPNVRAQAPNNDNLDRDQGITLFSQGETAKAITLLQAAVKRDKHDVLGWYYLGLSFERLGQNQEASSAFEGATKLNPEDYFTSIGHPDLALFEARFLEVKPQLVAAANSVVHYLQLNKTLSDSKRRNGTSDWRNSTIMRR